jgi:geranylgeranyl diphosphate synthase type I
LGIADKRVEAKLSFDLNAVSFPMNSSGCFDVSGKAMYGYTRPQSPVSGRFHMSGESHTAGGQGWLDHQWGQWTFQAQNGELRNPEWRYFGIPLRHGPSLVLCLNKQREQDDHRLIYGNLCYPDGRFERIGSASVESGDSIQSLRTRNIYEYGWRVTVPELEAELELTPFHPDHEVFTFTRERGILELGLEVKGRILGAPCSTQGFVETVGNMADIHKVFWEGDSTNTRRQIQKVLPRACTQEWLRRLTGLPGLRAIESKLVEDALLDPIWSMLDRGGKAWRGNWFVLCCHALSFPGTDEQIRELLPVIELVHAGSLIIDDIEDESALRRGMPAVHCQIGTDLAINAGNFLYFLPLLLIQEIPWLTPKQRLEAYERIAIGQRQGHLGQALDLMWSKGRYDVAKKVAEFDETRAQLLEQYRLKSGCQIEAAARIAGSLAEAPQPQIDALSEYSQTFGLVFQIVDDVNDASPSGSAAEAHSKRVGEDLKNGKLNIVLLHALAAASEVQRGKVLHALTASGRSQGERRAAERVVCGVDSRDKRVK